MSAPATVDQFLELAGKSQLLDQSALLAYLQRSRAGNCLPDTPRAMAQAMVQDGLLTLFQAQQLIMGRWRNFDLNGKYRILGRIGSGGMGQVYLCEHMVMRRRVAIKVLPLHSNDKASLERFRREARAVARLKHPNIVAAYDLDESGQTSFLVMEYIDGSTFRQVVDQHGPLTVVRACHYIRQAALGLQHAHEAGLVHRDIKPTNLLLDRTGTVKVLDLGLARFFHEDADELSKAQVQSPLGTTDYMAPEQALDSHQVDIRADIYSLGATFYFLLTGQRPFQEGSDLQKLIAHQIRKPKPIREIRPEVPEALTAVIDRMMAKSPGERYQCPAEVAEALAPWTQDPIDAPAPEEMPQLTASGSVAGYPQAAPDLPVTLYGSDSKSTLSAIRQQETDDQRGSEIDIAPAVGPQVKRPAEPQPHSPPMPPSRHVMATVAMPRSPDRPVVPASPGRGAAPRPSPKPVTRSTEKPPASSVANAPPVARKSPARRDPGQKPGNPLHLVWAKKLDRRQLVLAAVGAGLLLVFSVTGFGLYKLTRPKGPEIQDQPANLPATKAAAPLQRTLPAGTAPHAAYVAEAWSASKQGAHTKAIGQADLCVEQYLSAAQEMEEDLAKRNESFPKGAVDEAMKKRILSNGPLNDVATCLCIKGQSAEAQGEKSQAVDAYRTAAKLPHARCWDPQGWFWSPAELANERLEALR